MTNAEIIIKNKGKFTDIEIVLKKVGKSSKAIVDRYDVVNEHTGQVLAKILDVRPKDIKKYSDLVNHSDLILREWFDAEKPVQEDLWPELEHDNVLAYYVSYPDSETIHQGFQFCPEGAR